MKQNIFFKVAIGIIAFFLLAKLGIFEAMLLFLLAGVIPGLPFTIPSWIMLPAIIASIIMLTRWVANKQLYPGSPKVKASQEAVLQDPVLQKKRQQHAQSRKFYFYYLRQQIRSWTARYFTVR